ncbi:MAG TPA: mechanosensitive ion channel domain-containing protein [Chloroflexota bacterium]|nr:mechanosensitive ion channel domain-containing protein [Chloroflexota bacterium]
MPDEIPKNPAEVRPPDDGDPALVENSDAVASAIRRVQAGRSAAINAPDRRPKLRLAIYILLLAALLWVLPLIGTGYLQLPPEYAPPLRRLAAVLLAGVVVRGLATAIEVLLAPRIEDAADRYNLIKVIDLLSWVGIIVLGVTQLFDEWYAAVASVGLVSLVLGWALQEPISSFFAWIYILIRQPYQVGDRIQIKGMTGDVIQVGYLDTTLWEFGGPYLSSDHPSGRIIKFPNATVLNEAVINYTWPLFPYRWDEVSFQIAYDSDLQYVARTMQAVVEADLGEQMMERVAAYRALLAKTPVDELTVQERPTVAFRVHDNTWVQVMVRYVVDPREAGRVKTRLIQKLLAELNKEPERVLFPKSNMR